jgi:ABC-type transporter Mla MlaB component
MLRVTPIRNHQSVTLKLEGSLLQPWISELRRACDDARSKYPLVQLDLSQLAFVDADGAQLLEELIAAGMHVCKSSPFVSELLHMEEM